MLRLLPLLLLVPLARADEIYARQGSRPIASNVMIVEEGEKIVYLDKALKRRSWPKAVVGRVERRRSDVHEYHDRLDAAKDADAVMALADWAGETGFHKDVVRALHERALGLDANHEAANLALGRVRHEGEWMTPEEKQARVRAAEDAAMRAKGLVRWNDEWVTPEDKEKLDRGLRKFKGKWMTADEIKEAQGFVKHEGRWVKRDELEVLKLVGPARQDTGLGERLRFVQTPHYAILGDLPQAQLQTLGTTMERLFQEWVRIFPDAKGSDILPGKHRVFAFKKPRPYQKFVRARYERHKAAEEWSARFAKLEEQRMKLRLRETSFWDVQPDIVSGHVQMPDPFEGLKAHCVHFGANILATRQSRLGFPTWWLNEGLAYYFEKKITGTVQTYNADVGGGGYADAGPVESSKSRPWLDASRWQEMLLNLVRQGRAPKLEKMKGKDLFSSTHRLNAKDLAKSMTVVTFLIEDDRKKFAEFFVDAKTSGGDSPVEREAAAVIKHYGSYKKIEERWRQYALNGYRLVR
jgi:hypothetical protein